MADISMCEGTECPLKEECYRFSAPKSMYQSYFVEVPYDKEQKKCDYYWKQDNNKIKNK